MAGAPARSKTSIIAGAVARACSTSSRGTDEVGLRHLGAGGAQQLEGLGVMDALADGAHDLEGGLVDGRLVGLAEIADARGDAQPSLSDPGVNPSTRIPGAILYYYLRSASV